MKREEIEARISQIEYQLKETKATVDQQMANFNALLGAKQELENWLAKAIEDEKVANSDPLADIQLKVCDEQVDAA